LIVDAFMERAATPGAKQPAARRVPLGTLPAIPFEIVEIVGQALPPANPKP
jgi:hypothetical protein